MKIQFSPEGGEGLYQTTAKRKILILELGQIVAQAGRDKSDPKALQNVIGCVVKKRMLKDGLRAMDEFAQILGENQNPGQN